MNRVISFVALVILASCAAVPYKPYAREVKKKPGVEGVISLRLDHNPEDRASAEALMVKNCGTSAVNVLEEGEIVVGTTTSSNSKAVEDKQPAAFNFGGLKMLSGSQADVTKTETSSKTVADKEWQINYDCKIAEVIAPEMKSSKKSKSSKTSKATQVETTIKK
jgi:hypothetical protein